MPVDQNDGRNQDGSPSPLPPITVVPSPGIITTPSSGPQAPPSTPVTGSGQQSEAVSSQGGASGTPGISAADWQLVQSIGHQYGVDPYLLVAIGMHETGWGTLGLGRKGLILGVGARDSGPTFQWAGLQAQLQKGAEILAAHGVHTIQDVAAGKASWWASDKAWKNGVEQWYSKVSGQNFTADTSTAQAGGGSADSAAGGASLTAQPAVDFGQSLGSYAWIQQMANSVPELKSILEQATANPSAPWTSDKFLGAVFDTGWWKTYNDSQKHMQYLKATDPTEYQHQVDQKVKEVWQVGQNLGVPMSRDEASTWAQMALNGNWAPAALTSYIGSQWHFDQKHLSGTAATTVDTLRTLAGQYLVPLSDPTLQQWTQSVLEGNASTDSYRHLLAQQAKSMFPALSGQIDQGITVQQFLDPYRQQMAQTLELNPTSIDPMKDPVMRKALQFVPQDAKDPTPQVMPLWQFDRSLKDDPRWLKTDNARNSLLDGGIQVLKDFGLSD